MSKVSFININNKSYPVPVLPFGVEIECYAHEKNGFARGKIFDGKNISSKSKFEKYIEKSTGWVATLDDTLIDSDKFFGWEYISPVLKGGDGVKQVVSFCDRIKQVDPFVDNSTGLHIHIDTNSYKHIDPHIRSFALLKSFHDMQEIIFALTNKDRQKNDQCQRICFNPPPEVLYSINPPIYPFIMERPFNHYGSAVCDKSLATRGDVEFRLFHGNLDSKEILYQSCICARIVNFTLKKLEQYMNKNKDSINLNDSVEFVKDIDFSIIPKLVFSDHNLYKYWKNTSSNLGNKIEFKNPKNPNLREF